MNKYADCQDIDSAEICNQAESEVADAVNDASEAATAAAIESAENLDHFDYDDRYSCVANGETAQEAEATADAIRSETSPRLAEVIDWSAVERARANAVREWYKNEGYDWAIDHAAQLWRDGNNNGEGQASEDTDMEYLCEGDEHGIEVHRDSNGNLWAVADANGPWAVMIWSVNA